MTQLKLADFGLACEVTEPLLAVCGTPTYVAPEILMETGYGLKVSLRLLNSKINENLMNIFFRSTFGQPVLFFTFFYVVSHHLYQSTINKNHYLMQFYLEFMNFQNHIGMISETVYVI